MISDALGQLLVDMELRDACAHRWSNGLILLNALGDGGQRKHF
jgi:hypothetical protein